MFTSIFIPPNPLYRIIFLDKKKGHLPVTFFDRLYSPCVFMESIAGKYLFFIYKTGVLKKAETFAPTSVFSILR